MTSDAPTLWTPGGEYRTGMVAADKAADLAALSRSVIATPPGASIASGPRAEPFIMWVAQQADGFHPWGTAVKARDAQLRAFFPTENLLASALATVCARNAALSWKVSGDEQTAEASVAMINNANFGAGWEDFAIRLSVDLYSCDAGAFVEFVRAEDSPDSPVVGLNSLDSLRCFPTGDPRFPVIYQDTAGRYHRMPWYSVVQLLEMPTAATPTHAGFFYRMQYSAITRVLRSAQVLRSISIYKDEKVSGRFMRALHLISGVDDKTVQDAMEKAAAAADNAGLTRYMQPALVGSIDPRAVIKHETIEMASLPEGFDDHQTFTDYLIALALGFLTDPQEFAPLPGGGLGSAAQSETLHAKSRGRGPGLWMKMVIRLMNQHGALPSTVLFEFDEPDLDAEQQRDTMRKTRADERSVRIASGEIDPLAARQMALEVGDISEAIFDELNVRDEERQREEERFRQEALAAAPKPGGERTREGEGDDPSTDPDNASVEEEERPNRRRGMRSATALDVGEGLSAEDFASTRAAREVPFGQLITSRMHRAYSDTADDAASLGYFESTEHRIKVAEAVGPALSLFEEALREADVYDILVAAEDADRIVEASHKMVGEWFEGQRAAENPQREDVDGIDRDRLDWEAEVGETIAGGLATALRIVERQLRGQRAEAPAPIEGVPPAIEGVPATAEA